MLKNYFKIAWRNLWNNKLYSGLNIFGLAIGMAFSMLIGLWVHYQTSYDSFHQNGDRIAMVYKHTLYTHQKNTQDATPLPLYYELRDNYDEVKRASRLSGDLTSSLIAGDRKIKRVGHFADPDFLEMFSFPLVKGYIKTALQAPNAIILSESTAEAIFGTEDPIGKSIKLDNQLEMQVTAIMKDIPKNSSLQFDFLGSYELLVNTSSFIRSNKTDWTNNFLMNLVELNEGVDMQTFSDKIGPLNVQKDHTLKNQTLFLHPLNKWHLQNEFENWANTGGRIENVRLLGIIGIFVLLIACINFMNLSTARSEKRAKEVGLRKTIGSPRLQLIIQFLSESMLTAFLAFLIAILLIPMVLPFLIELGFGNIEFSLGKATVLIGGFIVCIVTGLLAGSYPALYLSSFLPIKVLRGAFKQEKGAVTFRKALVVSQFAISIGLIISTVIVFQQIEHGKNRFLGYDPNNLISIDCSHDLAVNYEPLKHELLGSGYIESVSKASGPMTGVYNQWSNFSWEGKDPTEDIALDAIMVGWDYEKTAGLRFKEGRPFSIEHKTDSNGVILNEAALKIIGYKDPIGKTMKMGNLDITIVGIVENVVMKDPFKPVHPAAILFNGSSSDKVNTLLLRLKPAINHKKALEAIQPVFDKYNPSSPFEYSFVDEVFERKFRMENQLGKLAGMFAGLAIFISCLGLFGLAAFMAERRVKEIGIRKVLGASIAGVWVQLSKEFVWLVIAGCLIASFLSYWLMENWLQKYDYRIEISWWVFAFAGLVAVGIALLTVSSQSIKAALTNPAKSLKTE